jgi:hypothetical protein
VSPIRPPAPSENLNRLVRLILASHLRVVGRLLLPQTGAQDDPSVSGALWHAPQAVVAHDSQPDPVFCYGNRRALELFEMDFASFTALPSRYSAEAALREERGRLLERVALDGFIDDYAGVRIASGGRRFRIERATVWNLVDEMGVYRGQAASFSRWQDLP